jgi:hypothetical protein
MKLSQTHGDEAFSDVDTIHAFPKEKSKCRRGIFPLRTS